MKIKLFGLLFFVFLFSLAADARQTFGGRELAGIKSDFKQVGAVARVKITKVEIAAEDIHPLYAVESEIVEVFKGAVKKTKNFTFYFHAEEEFDTKRLIAKDWIIFLDKERAVPSGGTGWYELENSKLAASEKLDAQLRKLKTSTKKGW